MKFLRFKSVLLFLVLGMFLLTTQVFADTQVNHNGDLSGDVYSLTGGYELTGNIRFIGDTQITFDKLDFYTHDASILAAYDGNKITALDGVSLDLSISTDYVSHNKMFMGIHVETGGLVSLGNVKVKVSAMRIGLSAWGGEIIVGDNSEIYAFEKSSGYAINAVAGAITVGNNAKIIGTIWGNGSGVIDVSSAGKVVIGDGAYILNDGTGNPTIGSEADTWGDHIAVIASYGGELYIGKNSTIETKADSNATGNHAVFAGIPGGGSIGKINIGNNAKITTNQDASYALAVIRNGSEINLGSNSQLTTHGYQAFAVNAQNGGYAYIGSGSVIRTYGLQSFGFYVFTKYAEDDADYAASSRVSTGDGVKIYTEGKQASGAYAINSTSNKLTDYAPIIKLGKNNLINTKGESAHAVYSIRTNTKIEIADGVQIIAEGPSARGVYATYGSSIKIGNNANITSYTAYAVQISTSSEVELGKAAVITAKGYDAIYVNNSKLTFGEDALIVTEANDSYGIISATNAVVKIGKGFEIRTLSNQSRGVNAQSGSSIYFGEDGLVITYGNDATGINATGENSYVQIGDGTTIKTEGTGSAALTSAATIDGKISSGKINIVTKGVASAAAYSEASLIEIGDDSSIRTEEDSSIAFILYNGGRITLGSGAEVLTLGEDADIFYFLGTLSDIPYTYKNLTATSKKGNLIYNAASADVKVTFTSESNLFGDLDSDDFDITIDLDNSTWQGSAVASGTTNFNLNLAKASNWIIGKDSYITSLDMKDASWVTFLEDNNSYHTTRVDKLTGTGNMLMNVDVFSTLTGDFLTVGEASGDFKLRLGHNNKGGLDDLKLITVTNDNGVEFSLLDGEKIQIGSYIYSLARENNDWYLRLMDRDIDIEYDFSKSILAMFELSKSTDATISDIMLTKKNKIWTVLSYKLQKFTNQDIIGEFKQQIGNVIFGIDKDINENLSIGQFFALNLGYQNFREGSIGHISNITTGTYLAYSNNRLNVAAYARVSDYIHDLILEKTTGDLLRETLSTWGFSASAQASYRFNLNKIYIEPKIKATYTYIDEKVYDVGGIKLMNYAEKGLVAWIGTRLGVSKENEEKPYGYYLELGYIHDTNPSITYVVVDENMDKTVMIGKNRFEIGLGFTTYPLNSSKLDFEVKYSRGKGIVEPIKLTFAGSFHF